MLIPSTWLFMSKHKTNVRSNFFVDHLMINKKITSYITPGLLSKHNRAIYTRKYKTRLK